MSKKNVNIKIGSDVEEAKKGINTISNQLNQLSKNIQKQQKPLQNFLQSFNNVGKALGFVKSAFSAATAAINDTINAYNKQATAEKQLEAAAKNNPYLSDYSVDQLKKYASELQSISTVGDEELLPMMAQLAVAGRTQAEIQDIMAASLDISASGAMSLESAVKNLNKTYSGLSGELGETNPKIKALTTEQLKNGEAVKIMKEQYSGIAKTVSDTTGGWQQFKNTLGDIKESLGSTFANLQNSAGKVLNNFFGTIVEKLQAAGKEADEFKKKLNIIATVDSETSSVADLEGAVSELEKQSKRIHNIELVALGEGAKVKSEIKKDAEKTLVEIANGRVEIEKKAGDTIAEYNRIQIQIEKAAADARSGKISMEEWKKRDEQLKAEQVRVRENERLVNAELSMYDEANKAKIESSNAVIQQAEKEVKALEKAYGQDFLNSYSAVAEERKKNDKLLSDARARLAAAKKEADAADGTAKANERDQKANDIITANNAALQKNIEAIERKYSLMESEGQTIDEVAKAQEILTAKESAYISLISEDTSLVTANNSVAKARLRDIKTSYEQITKAINEKSRAESDKKALEEMSKETEKLAEEAKKFVGEFEESKLSARIGATILRLMEQRDSITGNTEAQEAYNQKIRELEGLLEQVQAKESEGAASGIGSDLQSWAQAHEQKLQIAADFAGKYAEIMQGISDLACETAENEATVKQAELEKQLEDGLITEDEYAEKKEQIEKESAEKQYRMQMWAWAANLVNIQAQTALAIASTLAQEQGPAALKIAMSAMIGAMGAVQLATAIANKPVPPSFATGGVVGGFQGASMGGDNTYAHVRSGEMILNARQQRAMFDTLNGGGNGGGGTQMNVTIKNTAANVVSATPRMTSQGMEVLIRQTVRKQMENGDYDSSLRTASLNENGIRYSS